MKLLILTLILFFTSCVKNINVKESITEVKPGQCEDINNTGDMLNLLNDLESQTKEILLLAEKENVWEYEQRIEEIFTSIKSTVDLLNTLADPRWTDTKFKYDYKWNIYRQSFRPNLGTYFPRGFSIQDFEVEEIVLNGVKRPDLIKKIEMQRIADSVEVKFGHQGSLLELCQLHSTLNIVIKVTFRTIRTIKYRWFNLYHSKDLL